MTKIIQEKEEKEELYEYIIDSEKYNSKRKRQACSWNRHHSNLLNLNESTIQNVEESFSELNSSNEMMNN